MREATRLTDSCDELKTLLCQQAKSTDKVHDMQERIDAFLMPIILHKLDPRRDVLDYKKQFDRAPSRSVHQITVESLPDIGQHIRRMLCESQPSSLFSKLLQYSMPHVKHNRLAFPCLTESEVFELPHAMRCMLATCLGMYHADDRRPIWTVRLHLFSIFHFLLSTGSHADMHKFCRDHVSLLRLAIVEYYLFFVTNNLPVEEQLQDILFGRRSSPCDILRQTKYIINNFRTQALQETDFCWTNINSLAQVAIEKCNRACKGKKRTSANEKGPSVVVSSDTIHEALNMPRFADVALLPSAHKRSHDVAFVHAGVEIRELPFNILEQQVALVKRGCESQAKLAQMRTFFYVCLRCCLMEPNKSQTFKIGFESQVMCSNCEEHKAVARVNMIGNILTVFGRSFYFCPFCGHVHRWQQQGVEFFMCAAAARKSCGSPACASGLPPKGATEKVACLRCDKTTGIGSWTVVDDRLGVLHHVHLCFRHCPDESSRAHIKTLEQLREYSKIKRAHAVLVSDRY